MFGFGKKQYDEKARNAVEDSIDDLLFVRRESFFGYMAKSLKLSENSEKAQGTCSTDGTSFFYDPAWVKSLPADQLMGAVSHAVLRKAYMHPYRRGDRAWRRWNLAGHLAARKLLQDHKFVCPPDGIDPQMLTYAEGRSTEQIYDLLEDLTKKGGGKQPQPQWGAVQEPAPGQGKPEDGEGEGDGETEAGWGEGEGLRK